MARLNRIGARLMHKYNAHGATDVTGFGLLGHAQALARNQKNEVSFVIHNLPVIAKMAAVAKACGNMFQLLQGHSAETSGGLLICLPREQAAAYCKVFIFYFSGVNISHNAVPNEYGIVSKFTEFSEKFLSFRSERRRKK